MDFDNIIRNLDALRQELDKISEKVSREKYYLSSRDREDIFIKHIELATCFGLLENALNSAIILE